MAMLTWAVLAACAWTVHAQEAPPTIQSIRFMGNDVTQPKVMLREMVIMVGDPADPERIERSRQGVLDLGLFESVQVNQTEVEGGLALTFVVEEKWYLIPIPRLDANSEGESAFGISVRWFNVAGLNHSMRANWSRRDEEKSTQDQVTSYGLGYNMPFVFDSPYGMFFGFGHSESPITDPQIYDEIVDNAFVGVGRTFSTGPATQGLSVSTDLQWSDQSTAGNNPPTAYGDAYALGVTTRWRDLHYKIYSDEGLTWGLRAEGASLDAGSDYSFINVRGSVDRFLSIGDVPHQSLHLSASAGSFHGGPTELQSFDGVYTLGGTSQMRGYPGGHFEGDAFYYLSAEYLRPVIWNWLRIVTLMEVGNVFDDAHSAHFGRTFANVAIGLRLRVTFLVNVDMEMGIALPLDGGSARFFASKV